MNSASLGNRESGIGNRESKQRSYVSRFTFHDPLKARLRLHAWAWSRLGAPFQWGTSDCWCLCAEALDRLHGTTIAQQWRNRWTRAREAVRACRELPITDLLHALGLSVIPHPSSLIPPLAGDLLIAMPPARRFFFAHVALGNGWALSSSVRDGVGLVLIDEALAAPGIAIWRRS
jgi:hypothetical protein